MPLRMPRRTAHGKPVELETAGGGSGPVRPAQACPAPTVKLTIRHPVGVPDGSSVTKTLSTPFVPVSGHQVSSCGALSTLMRAVNSTLELLGILQ